MEVEENVQEELKNMWQKMMNYLPIILLLCSCRKIGKTRELKNVLKT